MHRIVLKLFDIQTKKEKRQIVQSMIRKLSHQYNVAIAETGQLENLQQAEITFALVANDKRFLERVEEKILYDIMEHYNVDILEHIKEWEFLK